MIWIFDRLLPGDLICWHTFSTNEYAGTVPKHISMNKFGDDYDHLIRYWDMGEI